MKIEEGSLKSLHCIGVYKIKNLINQKVYIGSTKKSFISRYTSHYEKLRTDNHIGYKHLQSSVNKYGIENFEFFIVEICEKDKCIEREEYYIKEFDSCNRDKGYNINSHPFQSPFCNKDIRMKAAESLKEGYRTGRIKPNSTAFKKGLQPWNKGKTYQSTEHLKVPKKKKGSRNNYIEAMKQKQLPIEVFDLEGNFINKYNNYQEIVLESDNKDSKLSKSMTLRNKNGREGYSPNFLFPVNIMKSCRTGKPYKGLIFKTISSPKIPLNGETP